MEKKPDDSKNPGGDKKGIVEGKEAKKPAVQSRTLQAARTKYRTELAELKAHVDKHLKKFNPSVYFDRCYTNICESKNRHTKLVTDECHRFAAMKAITAIYEQQFILNTYALRAIMDLFPTGTVGFDKLWNAMGLGATVKTDEHEAVKACMLECFLKPADLYMFDELFDLYLTSTPDALLDELFSPDYPRHLAELFSLLFGYGRMCPHCKNTEIKSCSDHKCPPKPSNPGECKVNETCGYETGKIADHKKEKHSKIAVFFSDGRSQPKKADTNKFMQTSVKSYTFNSDNQLQLHKFRINDQPANPVFVIQQPFQMLLKDFMPIYLSLERLRIVGDPVELYFRMTDLSIDPQEAKKMLEEFKILNSAKSFTPDNLVTVRALLG